MTRLDLTSTDLAGQGHRLLPWSPGVSGKFLIDDAGAFHAWRCAEGLAPHHAQAAQVLGVAEWVLDGVIDPDGRLEATAMVPGIDIAAVKLRAAGQIQALGLRFAHPDTQA